MSFPRLHFASPPNDPETMVPAVGPWAKQKLGLLQKYLSADTTAPKRQSWAETVYVDAFAGHGTARLRQMPAPLLDQGELDQGRWPPCRRASLGSPST